MTPNPELPESEEKSVLAVIQQLKDGSLNPRTLDKDTRQQCVEMFLAEGHTISSMAQILGKCGKTIQRDLGDIRDRNALSPSVELAKVIIGELLMYARIHRAYLMRLARTKDASVAEKANAEYFAARVGIDLVSKLQTLGYLPLKPNAVVGDIFHHFSGLDADGAVSEMAAQVQELEKLLSGTGTIPEEVQKTLIDVKGFVKKAGEKDPGKEAK